MSNGNQDTSPHKSVLLSAWLAAKEQRHVKLGKISRRRFFWAALASSPLLVMADAKWLEPGWVKVRKIRLSRGKPAHRFVHFTDVHHNGNTRYLESVVRQINALSPEFVCFTGDLIEQTKYLAEALKIFAGIKSPPMAFLGITITGAKHLSIASDSASRGREAHGWSSSNRRRGTGNVRSSEQPASLPKQPQSSPTHPHAIFS